MCTISEQHRPYQMQPRPQHQQTPGRGSSLPQPVFRNQQSPVAQQQQHPASHHHRSASFPFLDHTAEELDQLGPTSSQQRQDRHQWQQHHSSAGNHDDFLGEEWAAASPSAADSKAGLTTSRLPSGLFGSSNGQSEDLFALTDFNKDVGLRRMPAAAIDLFSSSAAGGLNQGQQSADEEEGCDHDEMLSATGWSDLLG
jgi:hypothetical protein